MHVIRWKNRTWTPCLCVWPWTSCERYQAVYF